MERRVIKQVGQFFREYPVIRLYAGFEKLLDSLADAEGFSPEKQLFLGDPLGRENSEHGRVEFWRPFLPPPDNQNTAAEVLVPILPTPGPGGPWVCCAGERWKELFAPSDIVSPLLLAAFLRSFDTLLVRLRQASGHPGMQALPALGFWQQRGPYLLPRCTAAEYGPVFRTFLSKGILLSPEFSSPSILPQELSPGERELFLSLSREV